MAAWPTRVRMLYDTRYVLVCLPACCSLCDSRKASSRPVETVKVLPRQRGPHRQLHLEVLPDSRYSRGTKIRF